VILLLAARTAAAATLGSALGLAVGFAYLSSIDELPAISFNTGLVLLAVLAPTLASVLPAWWAAQRDPVLELRTP
jgi:putative ABC transport system permease protein